MMRHGRKRSRTTARPVRYVLPWRQRINCAGFMIDENDIRLDLRPFEGGIGHRLALPRRQRPEGGLEDRLGGLAVGRVMHPHKECHRAFSPGRLPAVRMVGDGAARVLLRQSDRPAVFARHGLQLAVRHADAEVLDRRSGPRRDILAASCRISPPRAAFPFSGTDSAHLPSSCHAFIVFPPFPVASCDL